MTTNSQIVQVNEDKRQLEILLAVAESLGRQIHLDELLKTMVSEVTAAMRAERSSLLLYDSETDELYSKVAEGMQTREIRMPASFGVAGATAKTRTTINMPDAYDDPRFDRSFDKATGFRTRSLLCTPIIGENQRLIGVLEVLNKLDGTVFTADDEALLRAMCTHLRLAIERAELVEGYVQTQKMQQSLQLAHEIQMGMLPKFPAFPNKTDIDVYGTIKPALDVGGDLYDFFLLDDDHLCFVIGDVSDKGIPAALFMAVVRTAFRISAMAARQTIDAVLRTVNEFVASDNDSQMFVTMLAGIMDLRTGKVEYADGGHEPPFVLRRNNAVEIVDMKPCIALGVIPGAEYRTGSIQLQPGDALVLYTDGVNEAMNIDRQQYRTATIGETMAACCKLNEAFDLDYRSAAIISHALMESVGRWVGSAPQSDDITILVIRYCGRPAA